VSKHNIEPGNVYSGACENLKGNVALKKKNPYPITISPFLPSIKEIKITCYFNAH